MTKEELLNRFLNALEHMDKKYINILEETVLAEAELYSKDKLEPADYIKIICYTMIKRIVIEELQQEKTTLENYTIPVKIET